MLNFFFLSVFKVSEKDLLQTKCDGLYDNPEAVVFPLLNGVVLRTDSTNDELREELRELKNLEKRLDAYEMILN